MSELHERRWPLDGAKAGVVIVHGLAEHVDRYDWTANKLNEAGYAVYARDARGHGRSVGFPGDMGGDAKRLSADVAEYVRAVATDNPKTFLLGHSMGTMISLPAAVSAGDVLSGLILSGLATQPGAAVLEALGQAEPSLPPETVSRDPAIVKAYIDDPLVFPTIPQATIGTLMELTGLALEALPQVKIPTLLLHGTGDLLCDVEGARQAMQQLAVADKTLKEYEGLYHEVLNEPERDQVVADAIAWLDAH